MAAYKVLQDVEADDKLLGPLSLRQFIYAIISAVMLYLCYFLATHGLVLMTPVFLPVAIISGFFAFPWGRDQPTEIWALAKIRFLIKPRRRIWNQSGVKELVTITAPKQVTMDYTNGLSQSEVRSRLHALASTVDTRGWAVKNSNINLASQATSLDASDRLVVPASLPKPVEETDIQASDDILDEQNNAGAQRLQNMIDQKAKAHHDEIVANLKKDSPELPQAKTPAHDDYWFLNQPAQAAKIPSDMVTFNTQVVAPGTDDDSAAVSTAPADDEANMLAELEEHKRQSQTGPLYGHMHTIRPLSQQPPAASPIQDNSQADQGTPASGNDQAQTASAPVTQAPPTAILQLASNDDLNVATIAREAERAVPGNEVVIKLH